MKRFIQTGLFILCALSTLKAASAVEPDWQLYDALLKAYVVNGTKNGVSLYTVNYRQLKKDSRFARVVSQLETFSPGTLGNKQERLAFYINAYNILAIKMIIDHMPVKSIRDIGSLFSPVWKKPAGKIGGEVVTLHQVEHEVLRPMGDARIHMAIVCASVSCPDLRPEAYRASQIHRQLDDQTRQFLNNNAKGLRLDDGEIMVSKIFDWFEDDFDHYGGVKSFLSQYRKDLPRGWSVDADIDYDWSLNSN